MERRKTSLEGKFGSVVKRGQLQAAESLKSAQSEGKSLPTAEYSTVEQLGTAQGDAVTFSSSSPWIWGLILQRTPPKPQTPQFVSHIYPRSFSVLPPLPVPLLPIPAMCVCPTNAPSPHCLRPQLCVCMASTPAVPPSSFPFQLDTNIPALVSLTWRTW